MLRPTKHSHPDRTIMNLALLLLNYLKINRIRDYSKLRKYAREMIIGGEILFLPTLNFLYILGLIEYHRNTDSIEYLGSNETV